jgi:hypothetical protein
MKNAFIVLLYLVFLGTSSCIKDNSQQYETTVTVVDVDGKPIKDRVVSIFVNTQPFFGSFFNDPKAVFASNVTGVDGKVVLQYKLDLTDSPRQFITAIAQDEDLLRSVNVVTQQAFTSTNVVKNSGTIVMDSMVTFTMRLKTDRTDVQGVFASVNTEQSNFSSINTTAVQRIFLNAFAATRTPKLDTILKTKVYAKAPFLLNTTMTFLTTPFSISKGVVRYEKNSDRSAVFLQTF